MDNELIERLKRPNLVCGSLLWEAATQGTADNVRIAELHAELAASEAPKPARLLLLAFMVLFVVGPVTSLVLWMIKRGMTQ